MKQRVAFRAVVGLLVVVLSAGQAFGKAAPAGPADAGILPLPSVGPTEFWENFDGYATGSGMHGQGGWKGWDNNPAFDAFTTAVQAFSLPNSVDIVGAADLVHEFSGFVNGQWTASAMTYVPSGTQGVSYFIMLNTYNDLGPYNWSVQINFDSAAGLVVNDGAGGGTQPLVTDAWVELRIEIDLDADTQTAFYNGAMLYTQSWSNGVSGGGVVNIGAVDLFANGATSVFYDNVTLCPAGGCLVPVELQSVDVE